VYTERFDLEAQTSQEHVVSITLTEREGGTDLALIERIQWGSERGGTTRVGAWEANLRSLARLQDLVESLPAEMVQGDPDAEWALMPFECDDRLQVSRPSGTYDRAEATPERAGVPTVARGASRRGALERFAALFRARS
jgi:hypothetical protein